MSEQKKVGIAVDVNSEQGRTRLKAITQEVKSIGSTAKVAGTDLEAAMKKPMGRVQELEAGIKTLRNQIKTFRGSDADLGRLNMALQSTKTRLKELQTVGTQQKSWMTTFQGRIAGVAAGYLGVTAAISQLQKAMSVGIKEIREMDTALNIAHSAAKTAGVSFDDIKKAAQGATDEFLDLSDTLTIISNLIKGGLSLPQAVAMLEKLRVIAQVNKDTSKNLADVLVEVSDGLAGGKTKGLAAIKVYVDLLTSTVKQTDADGNLVQAKMTQAEWIQIVNGLNQAFIDASPAYNRTLDTTSAKLEVLNKRYETLSNTIAEKLLGALFGLTDAYTYIGRGGGLLDSHLKALEDFANAQNKIDNPEQRPLTPSIWGDSPSDFSVIQKRLQDQTGRKRKLLDELNKLKGRGGPSTPPSPANIADFGMSSGDFYQNNSLQSGEWRAITGLAGVRDQPTGQESFIFGGVDKTWKKVTEETEKAKEEMIQYQAQVAILSDFMADEMTNAFEHFLDTGRLKFGQFLRDLRHMLIRAQLKNWFTDIFSSFGGGPIGEIVGALGLGREAPSLGRTAPVQSGEANVQVLTSLRNIEYAIRTAPPPVFEGDLKDNVLFERQRKESIRQTKRVF